MGQANPWRIPTVLTGCCSSGYFSLLRERDCSTGCVLSNCRAKEEEHMVPPKGKEAKFITRVKICLRIPCFKVWKLMQDRFRNCAPILSVCSVVQVPQNHARILTSTRTINWYGTFS